MRLKTKKRYNRKKNATTTAKKTYKRRVQTKKRCHRGGGPEDSYVDFIDEEDHSGGIHVRYNESVPDKMWLIGPSSWPWTFRRLSEGVGMWGKNGQYIPFIKAWNQDAEAHSTPITPSDFLYQNKDVDSSYGMVISDAQFRRIFIEGALSILYNDLGLYSELGRKYRALHLQTVDLDDGVVSIEDPSLAPPAPAQREVPHPSLSAVAPPAPAQPEVLQTRLELLTAIVKTMKYPLDQETLTKILIKNNNDVGKAAIEIWQQQQQAQ